MTFDKVHFRHCLLYEFQQGHTAADAWRNLTNVFGQETPLRQTCSYWFSRFRSGNFSLDDEEREGRPPSIDVDRLIRPHIAKLVREKLDTFGWNIFPHPPYFHLFRSMQNFLDGKEFENDEEVKSAIFTFFASKPQSFFQNAISALVKRWHYIVDSAGEYCPDKFVE